LFFIYNTKINKFNNYTVLEFDEILDDGLLSQVVRAT